jgi:hypothetical protein
MANATAVPTSSKLWFDGRMTHVVGTLAIGASPLVYVTGGITCNFLTTMVDGAGIGVPLPGITQNAIWADVKGKSGYIYEWDFANKKLIIRTVAAVTPTGTITVTDGAVTVLGGAGGTALGITADSNAGALTKAAATTRTIPQATFGIAATTATFAGDAQVAAVAAELAASAIPAAVSSDTVHFHAIFESLT